MKNKVMELHRELIKKGKFKVARVIFRFLTYGKVKLFLSDIDFEVEELLENLGLERRIGYGYSTVFILKKEI